MVRSVDDALATVQAVEAKGAVGVLAPLTAVVARPVACQVDALSDAAAGPGVGQAIVFTRVHRSRTERWRAWWRRWRA